MDLAGSWGYIEQVASHRLANNQTPRQVSIYGTDIETLGAAGEIAARRFLGMPEKLHEHFDHGYDITWRGLLIDVKTTHLTPKIAHRFMQWPEWKIVKAEIILMSAVDLEGKQATVMGYAYKDEILASPINQTRYTPCHEIAMYALHPAWELLTLRMPSSRYKQ